MTIAGSVLDLMCDTPLVALKGREVHARRGHLWGKLELAMPGQMKDRVARRVIRDAEASGALRPGGVVVESSSGTMAEGLARVGAVLGYRVIIVSDPRIDAGLRAKLSAFGASLEIVESPAAEGGWQRRRCERLGEMLQRFPGAFWPRQYDNRLFQTVYEEELATELTAVGEIAAFVASVGSGSSICGTAHALRRLSPGVRIVAVDATGSVQFHQPDRPRRQSGHGNSIVAGNIDYAAIDEVHWVNDGEAFNACHELARREGIFAGGSSGAAYLVASWLASACQPGANVVALFPDRGDRYAGTIYDRAYLDAHGLSGVVAASAPARIRYGIDEATSWSWAPLPHDGSVPCYAPGTLTSHRLLSELGLA
ncbi:MAG: cysteine synthase family protein [Acidimicrobiia bacterium]|nr:cysteine synthase family protein [Acidimicrobiia bacterium]